MKSPMWALVTVVLTLMTGCARTDWIDRTLVTVDVTGVWEGNAVVASGAASGFSDVALVLQQQGARVTGQRSFGTGSNVSVFLRDAAIEGTVNGDTFNFHDVNNETYVDVTLIVNGDEMTGVSKRGQKWYLRRRSQ